MSAPKPQSPGIGAQPSNPHLPRGVHVCGGNPAIASAMAALRREDTDSPRFRRLAERVGEYVVVQMSRQLPTREFAVSTPCGVAICHALAGRYIVVPVVRAGIPVGDGACRALEFLDGVAVSVRHVGMARDEATLEPTAYVSKLGRLRADDIVLVAEQMIATGGTLAATVGLVKAAGAAPANIKVVAIIGAPEGLRRVREAHPEVEIHIAVVDSGLNDRGFIEPGLGDAGDRAYGTA